jgi:DNA-binding response OmpR family regulator
MANGALLIAAGDEILRRALKTQLVANEGFTQVVEAGSGTAAVAQAKARSFDLILLDVSLSDQDGWQVCQSLRHAGVRCPIIMLTAADSDDETITGLNAGANDYVSKPFRMAVLLARVRAQLRQPGQTDDAIFVIGRYQFQPAAKMLVANGSEQKIRLTEKETAILKYLYRVGNKTVPRETLLGEVWGYNAGVTTHTLETHVYRLRQKIETDPQQAQLLVTEPGGYRLNP